MGAFGSCLGVGRPMRPGANPRLLASSNLVNVDGNPCFGPSGQPGRSSRQPYTSNGSHANTKLPLPKLTRQSSSLSNGIQQQRPPPCNHQISQQIVPKLVELDDNPLSPFDKQTQNSHPNGNRKLVDGAELGSAREIFLQSIRDEGIKVLIALYDYEPRTNEDLGFSKGEHLETSLKYMNGDWWFAISKSTRNCGFVPSNYVAELKSLGAEPWYLGKIGRPEAELRLKAPENIDGAFIIRDSDLTPNQLSSSTPHLYSLSLKHESGVKHYRIKQFPAGGYFIDRKTVFSTMHDLVLHYSHAPDGLCINLRGACISKCDKPTTLGLTHDTSDNYEVDRGRLTLLHELGRGQFGQVYEGTFDKFTRVAVKTLRKGSMDPQDFLAEAQIMKKMRHANLVQLYAVCTREEPVYIITELMSKGALISYLQTEEGKNLTLAGYIQMATQIAAGMSYIEREKYVHRDLAARNILVGENSVCKIADFGLARFIKETEYEARSGARFPIKWTAPEAANFSKFTIKSDVWSFGIVLYEIITKGGTPYPDMSNADVLTRIDKGYRMPQPPHCDSKYYSIMVECWNKEPNKRPTFETLHWKFNDFFISDEQYRETSQFRDR